MSRAFYEECGHPVTSLVCPKCCHDGRIGLVLESLKHKHEGPVDGPWALTKRGIPYLKPDFLKAKRA